MIIPKNVPNHQPVIFLSAHLRFKKSTLKSKDLTQKNDVNEVNSNFSTVNLC